jgi:hypothetical protein
MREAGAPSTGKLLACVTTCCARPTGGNHGRTAGNFAQDTTRQSEGRAKCDGTNQRGQGHSIEAVASYSYQPSPEPSQYSAFDNTH